MKTEFHPREFPHGLRCGECGTPILTGYFYHRLTDDSIKEMEQQPVAWEGYVPITIIICEKCENESDNAESPRG